MKQLQPFYIMILIICSCNKISNSNVNPNAVSNTNIANGFIDAFYSFDRDSLLSILSQASESQPLILYYQKWAECANYIIVKRHDCVIKNDSIVICPVTVKDDLIGTLGIEFNVTDSFKLTIINEKIRVVNTSSNDPDLYYEATEWVKQNRPELIAEPCLDIWEGGPTPCDCVKAMIKGFVEFKESNS